MLFTRLTVSSTKASRLAMSLLGSSVTSYVDELRPVRPGKSPRRSPVIKLGATEAELKHQAPGPGSYSPMEPGARSSSSWSMSFRHPPPAVGDRSPGPIYMMRSSIDLQPSSSRRTSPRFGFGTGTRPDPVTIARRNPGPGPGTYELASTVLVKSSSSRASTKPLEFKEIDRSLGGPTDGPGPAAYSPRIITSDRRTAPSYSILGPGNNPALNADSPGPAQYVSYAKSRFGGGHMGDGPQFSISQRESIANRFISKQHEVSLQGVGSPGPATYTPREMVGVVDYTNSNTSRHSPMFSFGSEKRFGDNGPPTRHAAKAQTSTLSVTTAYATASPMLKSPRA